MCGTRFASSKCYSQTTQSVTLTIEPRIAEVIRKSVKIDYTDLAIWQHISSYLIAATRRLWAVASSHPENHVQYPTCPFIFKLIRSLELPLISVEKNMDMEKKCPTELYFLQNYVPSNSSIAMSAFLEERQTDIGEDFSFEMFDIQPFFQLFLFIFSPKDWPYWSITTYEIALISFPHKLYFIQIYSKFSVQLRLFSIVLHYPNKNER